MIASNTFALRITGECMSKVSAPFQEREPQQLMPQRPAASNPAASSSRDTPSGTQATFGLDHITWPATNVHLSDKGLRRRASQQAAAESLRAAF